MYETINTVISNKAGNKKSQPTFSNTKPCHQILRRQGIPSKFLHIYKMHRHWLTIREDITYIKHERHLN